MQPLDELQRGILGIPEIGEHLQWPEAARRIKRPRTRVWLVVDRVRQRLDLQILVILADRASLDAGQVTGR